MARTSEMEKMLGGLIDRLADRLAERINKSVGASSKGAAKGNGRRGRRAGRKLDMHCRVDGCKNISRGPRFGFICDEHRKSLSKKEQQAARDSWNAKKKAA
jgi:hypothetical protein